MDRYFYSVVNGNDGTKIVHLFGNVYNNDADETETNFRHAEWSWFYIKPTTITKMLDNDCFFDHVNECVAYMADLTEAEAVEVCANYFDGEPGTNLHIQNVTNETPCGDYWFDA